MPDVYVSRYVNMTPAEVLDALQLHRPAGGAPQARLGTPIRLHDWMALVPVTWRYGKTNVLEGNLRIITVAGGNPPVTEVLLVGYRDTGGVDAPLLLEDLLAGACPPHGRPIRVPQAV
jgi:hypothetical protein